MNLGKLISVTDFPEQSFQIVKNKKREARPSVMPI